MATILASVRVRVLMQHSHLNSGVARVDPVLLLTCDGLAAL